MIELNMSEPEAALSWRHQSPDIPIEARRRIKREEDISLLARCRPTPCTETLTPKGNASVVPVSIFLSLSRSRDLVVTLDIPDSELEKCMGRNIRRVERQALDGLVHLILHGQAFARRDRADGGYALIPYRKMEAIIGREWASVAPAIARLIGLVETDCEWREQTEDEPGKAIGYRLTEAALSWGFIAKRMPRLMAEHLRKRRKRMAAKVSVSARNRKAFQDLRRVTLAPAATETLFRARPDDTPLKVIHRIMSAAAIARKDWFFSEDSFGRIHHNVSNLHKSIRAHLLIDGEATVQIDIGNCQPTLLWANAYKGNDCEESSRVLGLCSARKFYPELCRMAGKKELTYDQSKKAVLKGLLFAKRRRDPSLFGSVEEHFPIMFAYIEACRERGLTNLSGELQRKEALVLIRGVSEALRGAGINAVTIHDAMLVKQSLASEARAIVERVFEEHVGVRPAIHMETTDIVALSEIVSAADGETETAMDPSADIVLKQCVTVVPADAPVGRARTPCPADLCPGCWALNRAVLIHSAFGCEHQAPRYECREA